MTLLSIPEFIGRFHPVLVHLPIGILLLGCCFQLLTINSRFSVIRPAIPLIYLLGMLGAVFSSITGYFLSQSGDYNADIVGVHQWLGFTVAAVSLALYLMHIGKVREVVLNITSAILILLVTLTGHYGGSLTHGSDYITAALKENSERKAAIPPVADVQKAIAYTHMVQPLLQNRCYSCHGAEKQKGKLRLDNREFLLKGGKDGEAIVPGKAGESELIKRLLLSVSNEDHMPPKEKPQLTPEEIALLQWWINQGADFSKKVQDLKQPAEIKPVLLSFQTGAVKAARGLTDIPAAEVAKADAAVIEGLKKTGLVIIPVMNGSNYLSVSFVTAKVSAEVLKQLGSLKQQLIWLNIANTALDDNGMQAIAKLDNLIRINLSGTQVTDKGLLQLQQLKHLQYINLVRTGVTTHGIEQLRDLKALNSIYLYQTAVDKKDWPKLKKLFSKVNLDSGGYIVPTFEEDTTEVKPPVLKQ